MEVFLVYKQFCNIKDVLSKPYDKLTYEDQLKMYDPLLFSLDELLEYKMEDNAQEGGFKWRKKKGNTNLGDATGEGDDATGTEGEKGAEGAEGAKGAKGENSPKNETANTNKGKDTSANSNKKNNQQAN